MTAPVFYTAKGELTAYALACGYREAIELHGHGLFLDRQSAGCYTVTLYGPNGELDYASFDTLTPARAYFRRVARDRMPAVITA